MLLLLEPVLGVRPFLGVSCGVGFFALSGLRGLGVTMVTMGPLNTTHR